MISSKNTLHILLLSPLIFLLFLRLGTYPPFLLDEGEFLVSAKSFALSGRFALPVYDELRGAHISVGPLVLVPIGMLFKVFGAKLCVARCVIALWSTIGLISMYLIGKKLLPTFGGIFAASFILLFPIPGFFEYSRAVMGEAPAIALLALGFLALISEPVRTRSVLLSGIFFGAAISAKPNVGLIIPACVAAFIITSGVREGLRRTLIFLVPVCVIEVSSLLFTITQVGVPQYYSQLQLLASFAPRVATQSPAVWFELMENRAESSLLIVVLWGLSLFVASKNRRSALLLVATLFLVFHTGWWLFLSIGWKRYLLPALPAAAIVVATFLSHIREHFSPRFQVSGSVVILLFFGVAGFKQSLDVVHTKGDNSAYQIATLIDALDKDAIVESYEWQIAFLTDRILRQPHLSDHYAFYSSVSHGDVPQSYTPTAFERKSDYLLIGSAGRTTFKAYTFNGQMCSIFTTTAPCKLVAEAGEYQLFKLLS